MTSRGTRYWSSGAIPLVAPELLGDIIAMASDLSIVVNEEGTILSVLINPNNRQFRVAQSWKDKNIRDCLTVESIPKLEQKLSLFADGGDTSDTVELNHTEGSGMEFPLRYSFHRIGPDGTVLMLGRDLRPVAEMQQQLVKAQLALEKDYETQREYDTRYRVLMQCSRDAVVFVNMATGRIADANNNAVALLGGQKADIVGSAFAQEFEGRRRGEFMESLTNSAMSQGGQSLELQARRSQIRLLLTPRIFRAAGEQLLLCRLDGIDAVEPRQDDLSNSLSALYEQGVDAIVFTDSAGIIQAANEAFLNLCDESHTSMLKGKSFGQFLVRGSVDLKVLIDNAARTGQMRMYATKLSSEYGSQISVEISATYLNDGVDPAIVFVVRDASRADAMRKPSSGVSDEAVRSVMEMVGSATLKDIVAETTDVVEKMCIETAVELTRNNRVAAAEMLGLSRQSLYVKLRKYGLLDKSAEN